MDGSASIVAGELAPETATCDSCFEAGLSRVLGVSDESESAKDFAPEEGEAFHVWLSRVEGPTQAFMEEASNAGAETFRRGSIHGRYLLLWELFQKLDQFPMSAPLLGAVVAGELALARRRRPGDFRAALRRARGEVGHDD
jgi:hypothetical protein